MVQLQLLTGYDTPEARRVFEMATAGTKRRHTPFWELTMPALASPSLPRCTALMGHVFAFALALTHRGHCGRCGTKKPALGRAGAIPPRRGVDGIRDVLRISRKQQYARSAHGY